MSFFYRSTLTVTISFIGFNGISRVSNISRVRVRITVSVR